MATLTAAGYLALGSTVVAAGGAIAQRKSSKEELKGQKEEGLIQRKASDVENNRRARRAIAARRLQQAEITSQSQINNQTGANSAVTGAIGSLSTQTAANIGASNTRLSADLARYSVLNKAARRAGKFNNLAAGADVISGGLSAASTYYKED